MEFSQQEIVGWQDLFAFCVLSININGYSFKLPNQNMVDDSIIAWYLRNILQRNIVHNCAKLFFSILIYVYLCYVTFMSTKYNSDDNNNNNSRCAIFGSCHWF